MTESSNKPPFPVNPNMSDQLLQWAIDPQEMLDVVESLKRTEITRQEALQRLMQMVGGCSPELAAEYAALLVNATSEAKPGKAAADPHGTS